MYMIFPLPERLCGSKPIQTQPKWKKYRQCYGFEHINADHYIGVVAATTPSCVAQVFIPKGASKTVLLVHGYLDHVGLMVRLIDDIVSEGYAVVAIDLPGHGLSQGSRGEIDSFARYGDVLARTIEEVASIAPPLTTAIGHSTGCTALMELYEYHYDVISFQQLCFLAPLVQPIYWPVARVLSTILGALIPFVPRKYGGVTHDTQMTIFKKRHDPLRIDRVPLQWTFALKKWRKRVISHASHTTPLTIIQGDKDSVVDYKHNIPIVQTLFPHSTVAYIKGAKHCLHYEEKKWYSQMKQTIMKCIV